MQDRTEAVRRPEPAGDFVASTDPFVLFDGWFREAEAHEINDPNAMSLATVDAADLPNVRTVLLKNVDGPEAGDERGFCFFTNYQSAKGVELLQSGKAALLFHWKSLRRQVRVRGLVAKVSEPEGEDYFSSRPRGSQIGAWASQQSRPLESREALEAAVAEVSARYADDAPIPRPPHWSGFRLTPVEMEFWHDRPYRLHERVAFTRTSPTASWDKTRLYP